MDGTEATAKAAMAAIIGSVRDHRHVLIVDRRGGADMDEEALIAELCTRLKEDCDLTAVVSTEDTMARSVTALMQRREEVTIIPVEGGRPAPKALARGRKAIVYMRTLQKKLPFPRRTFGAVHELQDEGTENATVRLCRSLLGAEDVFAALRSVDHHDLNLAVLVLLENLIAARVPQPRLHRLLTSVAALEEVPTEEGLTVQCAELLLALRAHPPPELRFTQHLCMFSVVSANRRRLIERARCAF
jgi:hypothetical protein